MKHKKLLSLLLAATVTAGGLSALTGSTVLKVPAVSAADDTNDDWLHAEGSRLFDKDGNEVWLTGANWFGYNCTECALHYLWSGDIRDMVTAIADRGINVLRIPVSTELLYNWMIGDPDPMQSVNPNNDPYYPFNIDLINPDGSVMNSQESFDVLLKLCKEKGIKVFIDIHSPESNNSGHNWGLWYGKSFTGRDGKTVNVTTEVWAETLAWTAGHYKNDDTLIGFDLKNEPHSTYGGAPVDAIWDGSDAENNWPRAAKYCADAILAKNPNALILIEGNQGFEGSNAWWGGNLRGVQKYPVLPESGTSQIVYSPHDYGPVVSQQPWFEGKNFTEQTLLDDYWYDTWAYLNDKDMYPLLIGEWGGRIPATIDEKALLNGDSTGMDDVNRNAKWLLLLRDYMINHHINHTFWCLNDDSGDTGGLWTQIGYNPSTGTSIGWDEEKYGLFEKALWQTQKTGKYIGLDHQTPLGANGLSLTDFYKNYANTEGSNLDGGTIGGNHGHQIEITTAPEETTATEPQPGKDTKWGDVDCNGKINIADAILLAQYCAEVSGTVISPQGLENADCSAEEGLGTAEMTKILEYLAGIITETQLAP